MGCGFRVKVIDSKEVDSLASAVISQLLVDVPTPRISITDAESLEEDFARLVGNYNEIFTQLPNIPPGFRIEPRKFLDIDGYRNPYLVWKFEETNALALMFVDPGTIVPGDFGRRVSGVSRMTWEGFRLMAEAIALSRNNEVADLVIVDGRSLAVIDFEGCHRPNSKEMVHPPRVFIKMGQNLAGIDRTIVGVLARALNRIAKYKDVISYIR